MFCTPFYSVMMIEDDMEDERKGRHFEYSDEAKEYIEPEERIHKGIIGSRSMTYAPLGISSQRDMRDEEFKKIGLFIELQKITEALEVKGILVSKVKELKVPKIDGSLNKIFYNIIVFKLLQANIFFDLLHVM